VNVSIGQSVHRIRIPVIDEEPDIVDSQTARVAAMDYLLRQQPAAALKGTSLGIPGSDIECHPPTH
jgi:hypothetical protein